MKQLNYFVSLINLLSIFLFFIFLNLYQINKEFKYMLIFLIVFNLLIKLYTWHVLSITKKENLNIIINNIFFNVKFTKLSILIFSIVTPIYMILQMDNLIIDLFIKKLSFLLIFIFSLIGFYLEFFILERKPKK